MNVRKSDKKGFGASEHPDTGKSSDDLPVSGYSETSLKCSAFRWQKHESWQLFEQNGVFLHSFSIRSVFVLNHCT